MERDIIKGVLKAQKHISTHALTWSATFTDFAFIVAVYISTHALTWSAT